MSATEEEVAVVRAARVAEGMAAAQVAAKLYELLLTAPPTVALNLAKNVNTNLKLAQVKLGEALTSKACFMCTDGRVKYRDNALDTYPCGSCQGTRVACSTELARSLLEGY